MMKNPLNYFNGRWQKDSLKSIPSAEEFRMILEQERARADRIGYEFSLLVFHLGNREDQLATARGLSRVLKRRVRLSDEVGWWGEEGMAVILSGTPALGAEKFADDIRRKMSAAAPDLTVRVYTYPSQWFPDRQEFPENPSGERIERFFVRRMSILKRGIDIVGSVIGLIIFSPLMLVVAVAIKLTSPGPVIFRQKRMGLLGKDFNFFKFRSMHMNGNSDLHKDYTRKFIRKATQDDGIYKIKDDPRVTLVGSLLRKMSLDELPQLINVLKGEMSLVGPRPPIHYECEQYDQWHKRRVLDIKPGITGLWQVKGRSRTTFDEMVRLDLKYAREWSLWLDIKILLLTPLAMFTGRGAY
jgi:exopolysaccharide biosynthesis polyprenyl glycosylphosphotransferase